MREARPGPGGRGSTQRGLLGGGPGAGWLGALGAPRRRPLVTTHGADVRARAGQGLRGPGLCRPVCAPPGASPAAWPRSPRLAPQLRPAEAKPRPRRAVPRASGMCSVCVRPRAALDVRTPERMSDRPPAPRASELPALVFLGVLLCWGWGLVRGCWGRPAWGPCTGGCISAAQREESEGTVWTLREQARGGCRETLRPHTYGGNTTETGV